MNTKNKLADMPIQPLLYTMAVSFTHSLPMVFHKNSWDYTRLVCILDCRDCGLYIQLLRST